MDIGRSELLRLTCGKATVNTAVRWIPFFLPTLAVAFSASTATLALLLGLAEASGLSTIFVGRWLDAGKERFVLITALVGAAVSSGLAIIGSIWTFAAAIVVLGVSAAHTTVGGHAWISARVPFERRARFIGAYEVSWASAMLIGVPTIAVLISAFGWRAPFIGIAVVAILAAIGISTISDGSPTRVEKPETATKVPIPTHAWMVIGVSSAVAMAGLTTIVVAGTWLDAAFDVSTGGVGLVAMAFGGAELLSSAGSSAFADRLGKRRTMMYSIALTIAGLATISTAGSSLAIGTFGLLLFFLGFEYSIVTSFSLVSDAMPEARGRVLGVGNGANTAARGVGVSAAGLLYESFGINGPVGLSFVAAAAALALLAVVGRRRPDFG